MQIQDKSSKALIYANLLPIFGVLFLGWSVLEILYIYWLETVIIGFITIIKMLKVKATVADETGKKTPTTPRGPLILRVVLIIFFIFHYGGFLFGYFLFIFGAFPAMLGTINNQIPSNLSILGIIISGVGLFSSHLISYKQNFIGKNEFKKMNIMPTMFAPYKRIVVLHMTIIFGMFLSLLVIMGTTKILAVLNYSNIRLILTVTQSAILGLFIWLKIAVDKKYHLQEHFDMELKQTL